MKLLAKTVCFQQSWWFWCFTETTFGKGWAASGESAWLRDGRGRLERGKCTKRPEEVDRERERERESAKMERDVYRKEEGKKEGRKEKKKKGSNLGIWRDPGGKVGKEERQKAKQVVSLKVNFLSSHSWCWVQSWTSQARSHLRLSIPAPCCCRGQWELHIWDPGIMQPEKPVGSHMVRGCIFSAVFTQSCYWHQSAPCDPWCSLLKLTGLCFSLRASL